MTPAETKKDRKKRRILEGLKAALKPVFDGWKVKRDQVNGPTFEYVGYGGPDDSDAEALFDSLDVGLLVDMTAFREGKTDGLVDHVETLVRQAHDAGKTGRPLPPVDRDELMKVDAGEKTFTIVLYVEKADGVFYLGFNGRRSDGMSAGLLVDVVEKLKEDVTDATNAALHAHDGQHFFLKILMRGVDDGEDE